ncbi:hypothetical protein LCGC14_2590000, partial [marine sediment metagenome]
FRPIFELRAALYLVAFLQELYIHDKA